MLGLPARPTLIAFGDGPLLHLRFGAGVLGFPVLSALLGLSHRGDRGVDLGAFVFGPPPRPPLFGFPRQALVLGLPSVAEFSRLAGRAFRGSLFGALVFAVPARPPLVSLAGAILLAALRLRPFERLQLGQPAIRVVVR